MKPSYDYDEVPEITDFSKFRPLAEVMPPEFVKMVLSHDEQRNKRKAAYSKQKYPIRAATILRLDPAIIEYFQADGAGYQNRINQVLLDYIKANS